ncbi:MAG: anaerobic ribonucleoside-triphosphate reductase activating protein [Candidatus Pacebacteria bacterium]|nr:anaerobic ribonucleoside-triphosphate reductase activating protein [Candidatus Paceibacterota bacterium]
MKIGGFQKFSLIDYPGKISCIIFFSGCNFRCPFCYSSELVIPEKIADHPSLDMEGILDYLEERKGMIEGVVFCGGEPTLNPDLMDIAGIIKQKGYSIKLDTNGSNPEAIDGLIRKGLIDYIAMDIKAPLEENKYSIATGGFKDIEKIRKSISLIKDSGIDYEFRSTIVPGIHTLEDISSMARDIAPAKKYFLQQFLGNKEMIDISLLNGKSFSYESVEIVRREICHLFEVCQIR